MRARTYTGSYGLAFNAIVEISNDALRRRPKEFMIKYYDTIAAAQRLHNANCKFEIGDTVRFYSCEVWGTDLEDADYQIVGSVLKISVTSELYFEHELELLSGAGKPELEYIQDYQIARVPSIPTKKTWSIA